MPETAVAPDRVRHLTEAVQSLRRNALDLEAALTSTLARVDPSWRASARNLVHYLALRQTDLRPLQMRLVETGLTSLGVVEAHVMATLDAVLDVLGQLAGHPALRDEGEGQAPVGVNEAERLLERKTEALFGPCPPTGGAASWSRCRPRPRPTRGSSRRSSRFGAMVNSPQLCIPIPGASAEHSGNLDQRFPSSYMDRVQNERTHFGIHRSPLRDFKRLYLSYRCC